MTDRITPPTIHLNGSSSQTLVEGFGKAAHAIRAAIDAVAETAPHMRDFYVQEDGEALFRHAQAQHRARLIALGTVLVDIESLGVSVIEQEDERNKIRNAGRVI